MKVNEIKDKQLRETVEEFEEKTGCKLVYLSLTGSKLYGTDGPNSDSDYKGVFIPTIKQLLTKTGPSHYVKDTNNSKEKNSKDDIDFSLHSVHNFFSQLSKSETGATDLLFSMFREDTVVFENKEFTKLLKENYKYFLNTNMKSFIGYALGQTKKFGIKGARYDELCDFNQKFYVWSDKFLNHKIDDKKGSWEDFKLWVEGQNYKYIKFIMAKGPRGQGENNMCEYISVLGKMFNGDVTNGYMWERIDKLKDDFGNRTKTIASTLSKTDYKALSHSKRIASEVKELLETGFIKFPLTNANDLKEIKDGKRDTEEVINEIEEILNEVDKLLEESDLPKQPNEVKVKELLLKTLDV